jgi:hypothetical protein
MKGLIVLSQRYEIKILDFKKALSSNPIGFRYFQFFTMLLYLNLENKAQHCNIKSVFMLYIYSNICNFI